jgi:hypothetical protein
MPPRTNAFQRLVTLLTATLAGHAKVTESAMLQDRVTGESREVDVLVIATTATYEVNLGIEVIAWGRQADTPWVEKMRAKHDNLPIDKLILVSESGFSPAGKRKAQFYGIETLTVDEACEADWPLIAALEETGVFEVTTMNFNVAAVCQLDDGTIEQLPIPSEASFPTSTGPITMDTFVRSLIERDEVRDVVLANLTGSDEHDFWLQYSESNGLWKFDIDGKKGQINELRIGLKVLQRASPVRFASGKFRSVPFVSGTSTVAAAPLQFVLARNPDGSSSGYLIDDAGVRKLASRPPSEA